MSNPQVNLLFHDPIYDHCFSADRSLLAVTHDNNLELYSSSGSNFQLQETLEGHDKVLTAVDISRDGKILTCSQDRNALVWEKDATGSWKPTLVLLRFPRAATAARWSPDGRKFAVASAARSVAVCVREEENDWWVSKHLKKPFKSTILSLDWHHNSVLLAAGSTDSHARVLSAYIKGHDERPQPTAWGERIPFNTICGEFANSSMGWVTGVAFSPSGDCLAYTGHDSALTLVYPGGPEQPPRSILSVVTGGLPFLSLIWTAEDELVAAGHDCRPVVFRGNEGGWNVSYSVDDPKGHERGSGKEESALHMFRQMDLRGKDSKDDTQLATVHQGSITCIRPYETSGGRVTKISTSGNDGRVVIFPLKG